MALSFIAVVFYGLVKIAYRVWQLEALAGLQAACNKSLVAALETQGKEFVRREELQ